MFRASFTKLPRFIFVFLVITTSHIYLDGMAEAAPSDDDKLKEITGKGKTTNKQRNSKKQTGTRNRNKGKQYYAIVAYADGKVGARNASNTREMSARVLTMMQDRMRYLFPGITIRQKITGKDAKRLIFDRKNGVRSRALCGKYNLDGIVMIYMPETSSGYGTGRARDGDYTHQNCRNNERNFKSEILWEHNSDKFPYERNMRLHLDKFLRQHYQKTE